MAGKVHPARTLLLVAFAILSLFFVFRDYPRKGSPNALSRPYKGAGVPRIKKVSMLYGDRQPLYERALRSHQLHNDRHNYPFDVLRQDIARGYWNKPSYLMSLIINELAKPSSERVEWLMWVDADLILINPSIPLEIFLPPSDFGHIHYLGNKDQNGLNTGTFFLRVHEWSVRMLAKSIAFPMFRPDVDLHVSIDQEAMQHIFNESEFSTHVLFQPRPWYNTYEFHHGYEGPKGSMLVHFPGLEQDRWKHMSDWLDTVERHPEEWEVPLDQTHYPAALEEYWTAVRESSILIMKAVRKMEEMEQSGERSEIIPPVREAIDALSFAVINEADMPKHVVELTQKLESLLRDHGVNVE